MSLGHNYNRLAVGKVGEACSTTCASIPFTAPGTAFVCAGNIAMRMHEPAPYSTAATAPEQTVGQAYWYSCSYAVPQPETLGSYADGHYW